VTANGGFQLLAEVGRRLGLTRAVARAMGGNGDLASPSTLCRFERKSSWAEAGALHEALFEQFVKTRDEPLHKMWNARGAPQLKDCGIRAATCCVMRTPGAPGLHALRRDELPAGLAMRGDGTPWNPQQKPAGTCGPLKWRWAIGCGILTEMMIQYH